MMLEQYTWQDFLIAACILSAVWYGILIPILYRNEIKNYLNRRRSRQSANEPLPHRWQKGVDDLVSDDDPSQHELMGTAKMPEGMESVPMDEFSFAPLSEYDSSERLGTIPDVLEEIKQALGIIEKEQGTKRDFMQLLRIIAEKYPKLSDSTHLDHICQFIIDRAPFFVSEEELEDLW